MFCWQCLEMQIVSKENDSLCMNLLQAYWPKCLVHKNKQRLTKITQYLICMRKLVLKVRPKIVTMPAKQVQRKPRQEAKAEITALLEKNIEKELFQ
jgi:protein MAK16